MSDSFKPSSLLNFVISAADAQSDRRHLDSFKSLKVHRENSALCVSATDSEIFVSAYFQNVKTQDKMDAFCIRKDFAEQIIGSEMLETEALDDGRVKVEATKKNRSLSYVCKNANDFPEFPSLDLSNEQGHIKIPFGALREGLKKVIPAFPKKLKALRRVAMENVLIRQVGEEAEFAATDGYRLHLCRQPIKVSQPLSEEERGFLVPKKLANMLSKLACLDDSLEVSVMLIKQGDDSYTLVSSSDGCFRAIASGPEEPFPRYEGIIPKNERFLWTERDDLLRAIKDLKSVHKELKIITFDITPEKIQLSSETSDGLEVYQTLLGFAVEGISKFKVSFNPDYLTDLIKATDSKKIGLSFGESERSPMMVTDRNFIGILMPVTKE